MAMLDQNDFHTLHRNKKIKKKWDIAETWDVTNGGEFYVFMSGKMPIGGDGPKGRNANITGFVTYNSNMLHFKIDPRVAQASHRKQTLERLKAREKDECTQEQREDIEKSRHECQRLAAASAQAAWNGPADRLVEYFQSADSVTREMVATVFALLAQECGPERNVFSNYSCSNEKYFCHRTSLAYTWPDEGHINYCPTFFEYPLMEDSCDDIKSQPYSWYNQELNGCTDGWRRWLWLVCLGLDGEKHHRRMTYTNQALITMRSMTQLTDVVAAETFGSHYGEVRNMTRQQNLFNSDSYGLFALSIGLDCPVTLNASLPVGLVKNMPNKFPGLVNFTREESEKLHWSTFLSLGTHYMKAAVDLGMGAD